MRTCHAHAHTPCSTAWLACTRTHTRTHTHTRTRKHAAQHAHLVGAHLGQPHLVGGEHHLDDALRVGVGQQCGGRAGEVATLRRVEDVDGIREEQPHEPHQARGAVDDARVRAVIYSELLQRRHQHARVAAGGVRVEELLDVCKAEAHAARDGLRGVAEDGQPVLVGGGAQQ